MPAFLLPRKGRYGLRDYEKMFCADLRAGKDVFDMRGVDRDGCMVVVRPDQYVAHVLPLDAHGELAAFFAGFMIGRELNRNGGPVKKFLALYLIPAKVIEELVEN